jgi:hypothetical protein
MNIPKALRLFLCGALMKFGIAVSTGRVIHVMANI